ncbi:MAG: HEPN domain-containing protein [Firmicutes bacterium]|nr:HEPN domain-containing protein [Bacillota bacterium]
MNEELLELARYRLEKARNDNDSSRVLFDNKMYAQSANRSYYAMFHAARGLLALNRFDSKKHSGVISYFNKNYIKTGLIQEEYGQMLVIAEKVRIKSDYDDFYIADRETAGIQLGNSTRFVKRIEEYINTID